MTVKVGIVGCGYVSYLYGNTACNHANFEIVGAFDHSKERRELFARKFGCAAHESLDSLIGAGVDIVANLTSPESHVEVCTRALEAGVHVYTEKPLALDDDAARAVATKAEERGLLLYCAPCSLLAPVAQTVWRALQHGLVGRVHSVYANLMDIHPSEKTLGLWGESLHNEGLFAAAWDLDKYPMSWPAHHEWDIGCAYEHAGYMLSWLTSWFGPVKSVSTVSSNRRPERAHLYFEEAEPRILKIETADLYASVMRLHDDVEVVMMNSMAAGVDYSMRLVGDDGYLEVPRQWDYSANVLLHRVGIGSKVVPCVAPAEYSYGFPDSYPVKMNFCLGISELAEAILDRRRTKFFINLEQELHIQEVVSIVASSKAACVDTKTTFETRPEPLPCPQTMRIGVIGTGDIAAKYLAALETSKVGTLTSIASIQGKAERAIALIGPSSRAKILSVDEVLDSDEVDLVVNLSSPEHHADISLRALEAGKHLYSEKPLGVSYRGALSLQAASENSRRRVGAAPGIYASEAYSTLLQHIGGGLLGTVQSIEATVNHTARGWHPRAEALMDFGMFRDVGIYAFGMAAQVIGACWKVRSTQRDADTVQIDLKFASGVPMSLTTYSGDRSLDWYRSNPSCVTFQCELATIRVELFSGHFSLMDDENLPGAAIDKLERCQQGARGVEEPSFCAGLDEMLDAIKEGRPHRFGLEWGLHLSEVFDIAAQQLDSKEQGFTDLKTASLRPDWL